MMKQPVFYNAVKRKRQQVLLIREIVKKIQKCRYNLKIENKRKFNKKVILTLFCRKNARKL